MNLTVRRSLVAMVLSIGSTSLVLGAEFPEGATKPNAEELKQRLADKIFDVKLANGGSWRLEYKSNGYFFINTNTNFNGTGDWHTEDGKICGNLRGRGPACNDARLFNGVIHYLRDNGEVVQFVAR
ncbi:MAG: hypothetical protein AB7S86_14240 [Hydrogenophaga sp.]|uniref:hypothetical protein n=1 Tax=Hydrogenophaga sp. TaxID=1904254 RepID=UPI003D0FD8E1